MKHTPGRERESMRHIQGMVSEKSVMRFKNFQFLKTRLKSSLLLNDEKEGRRGRQTFDPGVFYKIRIALRKLLAYIYMCVCVYIYIFIFIYIHTQTYIYTLDVYTCMLLKY